jgi:N-methylhydantoinase B
MLESQSSTKSTAAALDPILMAVLANRFDAIVREMTNTLFRTGRSAILNTAKDFSCCIITENDELLSSVEGLQVHVLGSGMQTRSMRELHKDLAAGDAFLHNDPYLGNTHTADHTILVPVFVNGRYLFAASAKAHQADCGNAQPSTYMPFARDVYEEGGISFPCVRVQRNYEDVADIIRMCRRRIRVPDVWYGDYLAAIGAARIGEKRILELVARYGEDTIASFVHAWLNYSEKRAIHAIRQLPAGRLFGQGRHDALPGFPEGIPVHVIVDVNPQEAMIEVDLRDNIDCLPLGVNLSESCATTAALIGVLNCIDSSIPHNDGSFRRIKVCLRENCVVGIPRFPTSCSMATTNMTNRVINATQRAFSELGDGYGLAEGAASMGAGFAVISGRDSRHREAPYINQLLLGNNGGPGAASCDGWVTYGMPDCAATVLVDSVEIIEQKYPIHIRSVRLLEDSGGAGKHRGAPASEVIYGPRHNTMTVAYFGEMNQVAPQGARGGYPGQRSGVERLCADGTIETLPPIGLVELSENEFIRGVESGGGGYGDPLERDPSRVLEDVLEGWVSVGAAKNLYGVSLVGGEDKGVLTIDDAATFSMRKALRTARHNRELSK